MFSRVCCPSTLKIAAEADVPRRTVRLSTAPSGGSAAALHGVMCRQSMAVGTRSIGGSDAGARPGSGRPYRSRWPRSWRTAATTASIVPPFAHTSRQRARKGYDADAIRTNLAHRNIQAVIPGRSNRRIKIEHEWALYSERNHIERFFGRLKINRAIATRYDQLAESFLSMV